MKDWLIGVGGGAIGVCLIVWGTYELMPIVLWILK